MKYILVTGAFGGMGSATVKALAEKGFTVFALDKKVGEGGERIVEDSAEEVSCVCLFAEQEPAFAAPRYPSEADAVFYNKENTQIKKAEFQPFLFIFRSSVAVPFPSSSTFVCSKMRSPGRSDAINFSG